jgi:hypothetical protein
MPRKRTGRLAATTQRDAQDSPNADNPNNDNGRFTTPTTGKYSINSPTTTRRDIVADVWDFDELDDAPLIPLWLLLLSDVTPAEIASRLRLNTAIRMLCDAIAEADAAGGATW